MYNLVDVVEMIVGGSTDEYISTKYDKTVIVKRIKDVIVIVDEDDKPVRSLDYTRRWEIVQPALTFTQAVESDRSFRVEHPLLGSAITTTHTSLAEFMGFIGDLYNHEIRDIMLNGKYYIQ